MSGHYPLLMPNYLSSKLVSVNGDICANLSEWAMWFRKGIQNCTQKVLKAQGERIKGNKAWICYASWNLSALTNHSYFHQICPLFCMLFPKTRLSFWGCCQLDLAGPFTLLPYWDINMTRPSKPPTFELPLITLFFFPSSFTKFFLSIPGTQFLLTCFLTDLAPWLPWFLRAHFAPRLMHYTVYLSMAADLLGSRSTKLPWYRLHRKLHAHSYPNQQASHPHSHSLHIYP